MAARDTYLPVGSLVPEKPTAVAREPTNETTQLAGRLRYRHPRLPASVPCPIPVWTELSIPAPARESRFSRHIMGGDGHLDSQHLGPVRLSSSLRFPRAYGPHH